MIDRRRFLAAMGLGAGSLFLPSLSRHALAAQPPSRFLIFYTSQGVVPSRWAANPMGNPADQVWTADLTTWAESEFSDSLRPLHMWADKVGIVEGTALVSAEADGSGARHERAQAHALTGSNASWAGQFPYSGSETLDQKIANHIARADRYRSLELSVDNGLAYDGFGSAIYRGKEQPLPPTDDPRVAWDRLFGFEAAQSAQQSASVLDAVAGRYQSLSGKLSTSDRQKLEAHQSLVRSLEMQVTGLANATCDGVPARAESYGQYDLDFAAHVDLITAAFSCDLTRVASIQMGQLAPEQLGAPAGDVHAEYAHAIYENQQAEDVMTEYCRVHAQHLAQIMAALDSIPEGGGTLLDSTLILWATEMADSWHGFDRYPWVYAGGGGALKLGQYTHYPHDTPFQGLNFEPETTMGRPHQKMLTTVCRAFGMDINAMPVESLTGDDNSVIDCTGILPEVLG